MQNKKKCSSLCDKKIDIRSLLKNKLIAKCAEQSKTSKKKNTRVKQCKQKTGKEKDSESDSFLYYSKPYESESPENLGTGE